MCIGNAKWLGWKGGMRHSKFVEVELILIMFHCCIWTSIICHHPIAKKEKKQFGTSWNPPPIFPQSNQTYSREATIGFWTSCRVYSNSMYILTYGVSIDVGWLLENKNRPWLFSGRFLRFHKTTFSKQFKGPNFGVFYPRFSKNSVRNDITLANSTFSGFFWRIQNHPWFSDSERIQKNPQVGEIL
jgi:hypothetical protein